MASTSTCPWGIPSTEPAKPQPSMQDLMDEALALSLYEEELNAVQREINPEYQSSVFTNIQRSKERREQDRNKELFNADSLDFVAEASGESAGAPSVLARAPGAVTSAAALARARVTGSLSMEDAAHGSGSGKGFTSLRESQRRQQKSEKKGFGSGRVESEAHATTDGVMDERTTLILQKMINRGELDQVHGCVQSGKEAHVYFAMGTDEVTMRPVQLAVKIFRTTLNEFGNRHEYVTGDRRFDLNFQKKDQRRQIKAWTDKEYRNLCRAAKCSIRAPAPIVCKEHVLVMQFVGADGWPEPTLKDVQADLSPKQQARAYADVLQATRALYQRAHLVHGDLSEYNILFAHREKRIWLIDFGQAIDRSHPDTEKLLRRDLRTINRFFQRGDLLEASADEVGLLSDDQAYDYVVSETPKEVVAAFPALAALLEELTDVPETEEEVEEEQGTEEEDTVQDKGNADAPTNAQPQEPDAAQPEKPHDLSKSEFDSL
ncbi:Serine/threonine-protein kinase RIO3 [Phytophthora citrophthora]|uniref:non-specific serine/threonine protein kinase n=1 Tax=Phytophthora citrophthora TaxID=4793 RepID=A0AAD9LFC3_9STRA|nr:Serine/threonine-protein kinase RIO3 [Phytophthora citrophthora]